MSSPGDCRRVVKYRILNGMKRSEIAISVSLIPIDFIMLLAAGTAAYLLRYADWIEEIRPVVFDVHFDIYFQLVSLISLIWIGSFAFAGLYAMSSTRRTIDEMAKIVLGCSMAVMILMFVFFFSRSLFDSRFIILAGWVFSIVFVVIGRVFVRSVQRFLFRYNIGAHRVVLLGGGSLASAVTQSLLADRASGYRVVSTLDDFTAKSEKRLTALIQQDEVDEVLIVSPHVTASEMSRLHDFSYVNHITVKFVADIFDFPLTHFEINTIAGIPIVEVKKTRLDGWGRVSKRIFDVVFAALLILLLLPLLVVVALAIKLDSRGPLFFSYQRIGENGRPFRYFKFRSMVRDAHKYRYDKKFLAQQENLRDGTPMMKFRNDPRVTRVGRLIRRFSIDELPELFIVVAGKMSLVGPRPHEIEEVQKYQTHHRKVLTIKPGMTGMAQVSGRSDLDFEEEIRLDTWYMENWSIKLDSMILFKTPWALFRRRQAE